MSSHSHMRGYSIIFLGLLALGLVGLFLWGIGEIVMFCPNEKTVVQCVAADPFRMWTASVLIFAAALILLVFMLAYVGVPPLLRGIHTFAGWLGENFSFK